MDLLYMFVLGWFSCGLTCLIAMQIQNHLAKRKAVWRAAKEPEDVHPAPNRITTRGAATDRVVLRRARHQQRRRSP